MLELFGNINWFVVLWLVVVVAFLVVELSTVTLTSIWFAAGGLIALIVAMLGGGFAFQMIAFLIGSFGMFFATKPWADKVINAKKTSTNADRVVGEEVRVLERTFWRSMHRRRWFPWRKCDGRTVSAAQDKC